MVFSAAVFKPEKEKSQFVFLVKGIASLNFSIIPPNANCSISGPPGSDSYTHLATLSKHSPAESSIVDPRVIKLFEFLTNTNAVFPPETSRHKYGNLISDTSPVSYTHLRAHED